VTLHCLLGYHDDLLHMERGRLFLRCATCQRETPGWSWRDEPESPVPWYRRIWMVLQRREA
jgi:hypothetical protein